MTAAGRRLCSSRSSGRSSGSRGSRLRYNRCSSGSRLSCNRLLNYRLSCYRFLDNRFSCSRLLNHRFLDNRFCCYRLFDNRFYCYRLFDNRFLDNRLCCSGFLCNRLCYSRFFYNRLCCNRLFDNKFVDSFHLLHIGAIVDDNSLEGEEGLVDSIAQGCIWGKANLGM